MAPRGFAGPLYLLPFDHRGSFKSGLFGWHGVLTSAQIEEVAAAIPHRRHGGRAGEEGRKGTDYFIWVMALISINLGLFNLLPIPALDGGHLMFLAAEAVLRRPLPLRVREVAHIVGMTIVISLMAVAFKNDLEKRWDVLLGQVREISG